MENPIIYKSNFNDANMYFWNKLNISASALKVFNIYPVKKYLNGSQWVQSSDNFPIFVAEFGISKTIIQPNSINKKFINCLNSESFDIFGYKDLVNYGKSLFLVDNEVDVLALDAYDLSSIAINESNIHALKPLIISLHERFENIIRINIVNDKKNNLHSDFFKLNSIKILNIQAFDCECNTFSDLLLHGFTFKEFYTLLNSTIPNVSIEPINLYSAS